MIFSLSFNKLSNLGIDIHTDIHTHTHTHTHIYMSIKLNNQLTENIRSLKKIKIIFQEN